MAPILFLFGCFLSVASIALVVCTLLSILLDPPGTASAMAVATLVVGFIAGAIVLAFRKSSRQILRAHAYGLAAWVWFVGPVVLSIPLRFGHPDTEWFTAYADTVSSFTTFGAVFIDDFDDLAAGLKVWRAAVGWLGGLAALAVIVVILAPTKVGGLMIGRHHSPEHRTSTQWERIVSMLTKVAPVYGGVTVVLFLAFQLAGIAPIDSLVLAMGTLSTSGIQAQSGDFSVYGSIAGEWVAIVGMLLGGTSFLWLAALIRLRISAVGGFWESFTAVGIMAALAVVFAVAFFQGASGAIGLSVAGAMREGLLTAVSLVTTTGYSVRPAGFFVLPEILVLLVLVVGGTTISTAGGFKVFRFVAMLNQARRELNRLLYPHRITAMQVGDQTFDIQLMKAVWASFAAFGVAVGVMSIVLAVDMPDYVGALMASVSVIATAGPVYASGGEFFGGWPALATLSAPAKLAMIVGMILGRLEILALLSLLNLRLLRA